MDEIPAAPSADHRQRAALGFILITVVLDMLSLGLIIPMTPQLIRALTGGSTSTAALYIGLFGASWAFVQFLAAPIVGSMSDRFGRRPIVVYSCFGLALSFIALALAPNLGWLFVGRMLNALTSANIPTASAYVADVTPVERRATAFGMIGAAFGFGFVIGPALGGLLGQISLRLPFWISAALCLANALYGFFVLPESLPPDKRSRFSWARANPLGSVRLLRADGVLIGLTGALFLTQLAQYAVQNLWVVYTFYKFNWNSQMVGLTLALAGLCGLVVQGGLVRLAVPAVGERTALLIGLAAFSLALLGYGLARSPQMFLLVVPIGAIGGLAQPAAQALMSARVDADRQGQFQGAANSLIGISGIVGPLLFTFLFSKAISGAHPLPGIPFFLAAGVVACALTLAGVTLRALPRAP